MEYILSRETPRNGKTSLRTISFPAFALPRLGSTMPAKPLQSQIAHSPRLQQLQQMSIIPAATIKMIEIAMRDMVE